MRINLKRRIMDDPDGQAYVLAGSHGAISWALIKGDLGGPITIHSPRPQLEEHEGENDCQILEMPCFRQSSYVSGGRLADTWEKAGRDDEVIWAELADWYRVHLLDGAW